MCEGKSKSLCALSLEEYEQLCRQWFAEEAQRLIESTGPSTGIEEQPDIIFIDELVALTGYQKSTIYSKVSRFEMPVFSRRKPLTFSRKAILKWLEDGKPNLIDEQANHYLRVHKKAS